MAEEGKTEQVKERTIFQTILKKTTLILKAKHRLWFLDKCIDLKIVPQTLQVKPPKNEASQKNISWNNYVNLATSTSMKNLKIARTDADAILTQEKNNYEDFLQKAVARLSQTEKLSIKKFDEKFKAKINQKLKEKYLKKLKHLKLLNNIPSEESRIEGFKKIKSRPRRFHKRSSYQKLKKKEAMKKISTLVFNLSDFQMTKHMENLLNHGLSFVPVPNKLNITQIKTELDRYERSILWKDFWFENKNEHSNEETDYVKSVLKSNKTNFPVSRASSQLRMYLNSIHSDVVGSCSKRHETKKKYNLSREERAAIQSLKEAQSSGTITIKECDKGGGVCIMNTEDYVNEMNTQLTTVFKNNDETESHFYTPVTKDVLEKKRKEISKFINDGCTASIISKTDLEIMEPNGTPGRLYGIPKIHKKTQDGKRLPPCRPIVSNSGSNTEHCSAWIDIHSKHLVKNLVSYVEDTPDILRMFQHENDSGPQPLDSFPVTIDVQALYTNIPTHGPSGGIQAFKKALEKRTNEEKLQVPTGFLTDLLVKVLDGNIFEFNGKLWQQQIGTAMGTKVAPTYACLFMGWLEDHILQNWSQQKSGPQPHMWRRYIDDIFFIWHGSVQELESFIQFINKQHSHIKFTATYDVNTKSIPFLDMVVKIDNNGLIETDLFKKDTAKVQYLLPSSCHPGHITKNIPYSLAYRLLRICSDTKSFKKRLEELRQDLLSRCYKPKLINDAFKRIAQIERSEALKRVSKAKDENTVLVTTFHPNLPPISKIVKKHWKVMTDESPRLKRCFQKPSVVAYKRPKNLRDMLIRAKIPQKKSSRKIDGFRNCGELCSMCPFSPSDTTKNHTCNQTKTTYKINSPINCKTSGVVYRITCKKCPKFVYIGETGRPIRKRFYEHHRDVQIKDLKKPCGEHFNKPGHSESDMVIVVIEQVLPKQDTLLRKRRETFWINQYQSVDYGANLRS